MSTGQNRATGRSRAVLLIVVVAVLAVVAAALTVVISSNTYDPAERTLSVGAAKESGGKRTIISHDAKMYRGVVARACLLHPEATGSVSDLVAMLQSEVKQDPRNGGPVSVEHADGAITVVARK